MSRSIDRRWDSTRNSVRLVAAGTRVVVIKPDALPITGSVTDVRTAPYLRPYVVTCDDGALVYASSHDLALESDAARTPLCPRPLP